MQYDIGKMSGLKGSFMKKTEHIIKKVDEGSIAWEMEIEPGDILLKINDEEIEDIFDYQFLIQDTYIEVLVEKTDGEQWLLEIDKEFDGDTFFPRIDSEKWKEISREAGSEDSKNNFK